MTDMGFLSVTMRVKKAVVKNTDSAVGVNNYIVKITRQNA